MLHSSAQAKAAFDPVLRVLHWLLAFSVLSLIATSQLADLFEHTPTARTLWHLHVASGYALTSGLLTRLLWGFIGPVTARWGDLWHPAAWRRALRSRRLPHEHRFGHDPIGSAAYLFAYGVMALMAVTGLCLAAAKFKLGPLATWLGGERWVVHIVGEPHSAGFALMLGFVALHLAALVYHQRRGEHVAQSMITGKQYH